MSDLNQCTFTGRLGADPKVKSFQNGGRVANLRLAVSDQWKDKNTGERKEKTEWVSVTIHSDGLIGVVERFLKKGSRILIVGKQQTRKWSDQSGNDRYSTEFVLSGFDAKLIMLDGKQDGERPAQQRDSGSTGTSYHGKQQDSYADDDSDIPF